MPRTHISPALRVIVLAVVFCLLSAIFAVASPPSARADSGCPSPTEPASVAGVYQVSTVAELMWVKEANVGGVDAQFGYSYVLVNDIDLAGCTWNRGIADAAGTGNCVSVTDGCFTGIFDGGGFTVRNLTLTSTSSNSAQWVGFIGNLVGGTLRDLTLSGAVTSTYTGSGSFDSIYTGIAVGYARSGATISNVTTSGSVSASGTDTAYVGGVIGNYSGLLASGLTSSASVTAGVLDSLYVGGVLGYSYGSLENNRATGTVTVTGADYVYAGGVTGYLSSSDSHTASDLSADVNMTISNAATVYAGGITSQHNSPTLIRASTAGTITVTATSTVQAGGIAGQSGPSALTEQAFSQMIIISTSTGDTYLGGLYGMSGSAPIVDSIAVGSIVGTVTADGSSRGLYGGGLVGSGGGGATTGSLAAGSVELRAMGVSPTTNIYAGGLFGFAGGDIERSFSTGPAIAEQSTTGSVFAGGLVGYSTQSFFQAYSLGDVTVTATTGDVFAGGLIGKAYLSSETVAQTYSRGTVTVTATGTTSLHSLIGEASDPSVSASVCLIQESSATCDSNSQGTPVTLSAMQDIGTFVDLGWPIVADCYTGTDWGICPSIFDGTPFLRSFAGSPVDPSKIPPPWLRAFGRAEGAQCPDGWGAGWAQWPNSGQGGFVCNQETYWNVDTGRWAIRAA